MRRVIHTPISGFPEFLPQEQILFNRLKDLIRQKFELYGAVPIETPAIERLSTLLAKGGNKKEIYGIHRLATENTEFQEKDLGLRFDLTVPLARYVADHEHDLTFPFRRYQIQTVWRGERPQAGRYREFLQCDFDVIGKGHLSLFNDAEILAMVFDIFHDMQIGPFVISINNRKILTGFVQSLALPEKDTTNRVISVIDKLEKIGLAQARNELKRLGLSEQDIEKLVEFFSTRNTNEQMLRFLRKQKINPLFEEGVEELHRVIEYLKVLQIPAECYQIDLSIARGLDYYTGTIFETRLVQHPGIGSVCSGGRYDHLIGLFLNAERNYPGVGFSIGLTRLYPRLRQAGVLEDGPATVAPVLVTAQESAYLLEYIRMAAEIRDHHIGCEVFTEPKKLATQMKYAHRKGFTIAIIAGQREFSEGTVIVRHLFTGEQKIVPREELVTTVKKFLNLL